MPASIILSKFKLGAGKHNASVIGEISTIMKFPDEFEEQYTRISGQTIATDTIDCMNILTVDLSFMFGHVLRYGVVQQLYCMLYSLLLLSESSNKNEDNIFIMQIICL